MSDHNRKILTTLQSLLQPQLGEGDLAEQNGTLFLRLFPALLEDGTGHVYMEICLAPYSDELTVAQIYSTLIPKSGPHTDQLAAHFADWNLHSLAGAYGLYGDDQQLYHKQNVALINGESEESHIKTLLASVSLAMDEMARRLPEAIQIAFGSQA